MPWRGKGFRAIALSRFHTYSVIWLPEGIEYFVDGVSYLKASPATIPAGTAWGLLPVRTLSRSFGFLHDLKQRRAFAGLTLLELGHHWSGLHVLAWFR